MENIDVIIDRNLCVACGLCEEILPEYFVIRNQTAMVRPGAAADPSEVLRVAGDCPAQAIRPVRGAELSDA